MGFLRRVHSYCCSQTWHEKTQLLHAHQILKAKMFFMGESRRNSVRPRNYATEKSCTSHSFIVSFHRTVF